MRGGVSLMEKFLYRLTDWLLGGQLERLADAITIGGSDDD